MRLAARDRNSRLRVRDETRPRDTHKQRHIGTPVASLHSHSKHFDSTPPSAAILSIILRPELERDAPGIPFPNQPAMCRRRESIQTHSHKHSYAQRRYAWGRQTNSAPHRRNSGVLLFIVQECTSGSTLIQFLLLCGVVIFFLPFNMYTTIYIIHKVVYTMQYIGIA